MGLCREQYNCFRSHATRVTSKTKRELKREMARKLRRWGKRDPENAPRKSCYRGWVW